MARVLAHCLLTTTAPSIAKAKRKETPLGYPDIAWKEGLEIYLEQAIALLFSRLRNSWTLPGRKRNLKPAIICLPSWSSTS